MTSSIRSTLMLVLSLGKSVCTPTIAECSAKQNLEPCISNNQDKNLGCSQSKDVKIVIFIALKECLCELVVPCT